MKERLIACLIACVAPTLANAIPITSLDSGASAFASKSASQAMPTLEVDSDLTTADSSAPSPALSAHGLLTSVDSDWTPTLVAQKPRLQVRYIQNHASALSDSHGAWVHLGRKEVPEVVSVSDRSHTALLMLIALSGVLVVKPGLRRYGFSHLPLRS